MNDVVNMKDFYNHETRISIVEHAVVSIDKRFEQVEKRFDQLDIELKAIRRDMKTDFRWFLAIIVGLGTIMAHGFHWF